RSTTTASTELYSLSLHDALPIYWYPHEAPNPWRLAPNSRNESRGAESGGNSPRAASQAVLAKPECGTSAKIRHKRKRILAANPRSEEHTSELQSRFDLVCRLLLE